MYAAPLAWVNVTVYDYRGHLQTGQMPLAMWTYAEDPHAEDVNMLNPMGTAVANPEKSHATLLTIGFPTYNEGRPVCYPKLDEVSACIALVWMERPGFMQGGGGNERKGASVGPQAALEDCTFPGTHPSSVTGK